MAFSFTGPDEITNVPEFRCFWLPEELEPGEFMYLDLDTWNRLRQEAGLGPWKDEN